MPRCRSVEHGLEYHFLCSKTYSTIGGLFWIPAGSWEATRGGLICETRGYAIGKDTTRETNIGSDDGLTDTWHGHLKNERFAHTVTLDVSRYTPHKYAHGFDVFHVILLHILPGSLLSHRIIAPMPMKQARTIWVKSIPTWPQQIS